LDNQGTGDRVSGPTKLSVNVNKIATLRNSRGGTVPSVTDAVGTCLDAGAPGITVHPRADERHIRPSDVTDIARMLGPRGPARRAEFNIEGDPRAELIELVRRAEADQCTLVPVLPGEVTSQAGWSPDTPADELRAVVRRLQTSGVRVSLFIEPLPEAVAWAAALGADRVELYTEPFAKAFEAGGTARQQSFDRYAAAARLANTRGLGVNAGHDLDLENLRLFRTVPHLAEVSIGHALISHALWVGLGQAVREYLDAIG
jgi:pyridoxine 5-phosphate synthase